MRLIHDATWTEPKVMTLRQRLRQWWEGFKRRHIIMEVSPWEDID